ncbi:MAG TPA: hypothetical protein PKE21_13875 [Flavobacteriales bacterium]|nr:hypothetical protein [Flavobacteriales bacterium]HMR28566.1 hypothetical protein [Flavobacteriales bacterium]
MRKVQILQFQWPVNLAIQEYGSVEGLFLLMADNPILKFISAPPRAGTLIDVRSAPADQDVATYYRTNDLHPVCGPVIDVTVPGDFNQDFSEDFNNQLPG